MRPRSLALAVLGVALAASEAAADPTPTPADATVLEIDNCDAPPANFTADQLKAAAAEHYDRGETLYEQGDYRNAVDDLVWAYCMAPRYYTILKSIGQAYERALEFEKAIGYFQRYVEKIPPDAKRQNACDPDPQADKFTTKSRIKVLEELPARVQIDTPVQATVELTADDAVVGRQEQSGAPFEVRGGKTYTAKIRAPGYVTVTRLIRAQIGKPTTEYVELAREKGRLRVSVTPPDAKISLDDHYYGVGEIDVKVDARHYTISIDANDYTPKQEDIAVLPNAPVERSFELDPIPQVGRRQLLAFSAFGGAAFGATALGATGSTTLRVAGGVVGTVGGLAAAYYGTEPGVALGTSSLTITSSVIGAVAGVDVGLIFGNGEGVLGTNDNSVRAIGGTGLAVGAVIGYLAGEASNLHPGDAAVINSGAVWGGAAGHLLAAAFQPTNTTTGGLGLAGLTIGTTSGVLLQRYYTVSRKHAALIDVGGIAGMVTGVAAANLIFNQGNLSGTQSVVQQERTADFALGGLAIGLFLAGTVTRDIDTPRIPVQLEVGNATDAAGKAQMTVGIGGVFP